MYKHEEYLIDTLPGWHIEDFPDYSLPPFGFSKSGGDNGVSLQSNKMGIWVPQIPQILSSSYKNQYFSQDNNYNFQFGMYNDKETSVEVHMYATVQNMKQQGQNERWYDDGAFTVPQIITISSHPPPLPSNKRSRSSW
ncbi:B-box zinc finger protein 21 [Raphanus sativus]|nr:B-box zinc finger protein 21 [Raphanus sativus]